MNINAEKMTLSYDEQLIALEQRLEMRIEGESATREIQRAFETLLAGSSSAESDICSVLQKCFSKGKLRKETYQMVQQLLNRIVIENVDTDSGTGATETHSPDPFSDTTVIPEDSFVPVAAEDSVQVGTVLRDRFLLQQKAPGGSMGAVYKALDRRLAEVGSDDAFVAIKVLAPKLSRNGNALRALQQEAAKGRCLSHPNIVRFIDLDREDDLYFIVMEWLDGRSLADILDDGRNSKIDTDTALDIVRQIGQALDYAHRCGVIHADVKPGNVMITPSGQAKLFDFGVARVRQKQHSGESDFVQGGLIAATPVYSSMQVLTGEEPVPADDVFSLGCLLYRLLAGYRAFGARNAAEAAAAGMEPQRLQNISQTQWSALKKSLAYSRVARFASVDEFLRALDTTGKSTAAMETLPTVDDVVERRSVWPYALVLLVLVTGAIFVQQTGWIDRLSDVQAVVEQSLAPDAVDSAGEPPVAQADAPVAPGIAATDQVVSPVPGTANEPQESLDSLETVLPDNPAPVDFSQLPPADLVVSLAAPGSKPTESSLTLTEDGKPGVVDFVRASNIALPLTLRLEEVSYSGNRSPWESGQYTLENEGRIYFAAGQTRSRTIISMTSDPLREPDREIVLRVRDADYSNAGFALVNLRLKDDDQRAFESGLSPNTVAFAVSQVSVRERDPAVQIDVLRFNPDDSELTVAYFVRDVTATDGEDYFAPATGTVSFGPGQRTARIFIPLVQDAVRETDEAFMLELDPQIRKGDTHIFTRIAVMIRDDDT
jgi:serine/threonine protein kinase